MNLIEQMTIFSYILPKEGTPTGAALILLAVGT